MAIDLPDVTPNAERDRLSQSADMGSPWRLWGAYLAERAWGSVREDYSADGEAWGSFTHDSARSRAYRWNEDGLAGICDRGQRLCLALSLWNGVDPILKERAFGLSGKEGNHGEDVKELYFYRDATPTHSWLRYLYKYPQSPYPYENLRSVSLARNRSDPTYTVLDTGAFDQGYWDVEVSIAKVNPMRMHVRIAITNRGNAQATLHLLPTLWCRNTWSWGDEVERPRLALDSAASMHEGIHACASPRAWNLLALWRAARADPLHRERDE